MKNTVRVWNTSMLLGFVMTILSCHGQTKKGTSPNLTAYQQSVTAGEERISLPEGVRSETMFRCSMKDKEGNLWFGTTGAGVYRYDGKYSRAMQKRMDLPALL